MSRTLTSPRSIAMRTDLDSFDAAFRRLTRFRVVGQHSDRQTYRRYADTWQAAQDVKSFFEWHVADEFGVRLTLPDPPAGGAALGAGRGETAAALTQGLDEYGQRLGAALRDCPYLGRVETLDHRNCRVSFSDAVRSRGVLQTHFTATRHEHYLAHTKARRLDDLSVRLPAKQQRVVARMSPALQREVRVLTGLLVQVDQQEQGVVHRDNALGRVVRRVGETMSHAAGALASVTTAMNDPVLVFGDMAFSGWIETEESSHA